MRRERRRAWKGFPGGRRATHATETTYGKGQRDRDRREAFSAFCAHRRAATAGTEADR
jgi:hypothetical protein